ncbi:hypothetical protein C8J57DRAFT_205803 [Mycena rebaudengoi]|nr:hypothetical protein C8J57DRAFT_205803 [Mycena rebaudengoi]
MGKRTAAPSASDFPELGCSDEEAVAVIGPLLPWLCSGSQNTQADKFNYLEQRLHVFNKGNLKLDESGEHAFKKLRTDPLPPFSETKWNDLAALYSLGTEFAKLPRTENAYLVPKCYLPFSLHRRIKLEGWVKMDVNGDVSGQQTEAGLANIGSYAIEAVLSLFSGRLVNRNEWALPATSFSSGGRVKYEIHSCSDVLLIVVEFTKNWLTNDHAAQLFVELISATEKNGMHTRRVHGLLNNMNYQYFFSYCPTTKRFDQGPHFCTGGGDRMSRLNNMVPAINHLFSTCLEAMKDYSGLCQNLSARRTDGDSTSSSLPQKVTEKVAALPVSPAFDATTPEKRRSLPLWKEAYELLCEAQSLMQLPFEDTAKCTIAEIESRGAAGLDLVQRAMLMIPRFSLLEGDDPQTYQELEILIAADSHRQEARFLEDWIEDEREKRGIK